MTAAATPGRELLNQCWSTLVEMTDRTSPEEYPDMRLITRDELDSFLRLAAQPSTDPDAMNERRTVEDAKLAANVREAVLTEIGRSDDKAVREALKPFADAASYYDDASLSPGEHPWRDDDTANPVFSVRQLRAARKALSTMGEPKSC